MTDLFVGGEDTSFTFTGTPAFTTSGSGTQWRAGFARGKVTADTSAADPPANRIAAPAFAAQSSLWVHAQFSNQNVASTTNNATLMRLLDGANARIVLRSTTTSGQIKIDKRNAAGTFTNLVTSAAGALPAKASPTALDLFVSYGASGRITLYVDGVSVADTGAGVDVTTDGATTLNALELASVVTGGGWSEVLVRDASTLGAAVVTLPPVASGNTQSWTPNTVGNVNEAVLSDATTVTTTSANALQQWTVATTLPTGSWAISSVQQDARVSRGASGPQNFEWLVRTVDGTDHVTGTVNPTTSLANYRNNWPVNPQTSGAWSAGDLINAGIESLA